MPLRMQKPDRHRVGRCRALHAGTCQGRAAAALAHAACYGRRAVCSARRLRLGAPAARVRAARHGASLVLAPVRSGVFERMMRVLAALDRACAGRDPFPTAAVMDAQAARSGTVGVAGPRGYDPARRVVGRKRHALVDTGGRLLGAAVSPASLHDSHGGIALLRASRETWPSERRFADSAYAGQRVGTATAVAVTVVSAAPGKKGFAVQLRRWVVERTFGHAGRCRRLARDHEATDEAARGFFVLANAMLLVRRLAQKLEGLRVQRQSFWLVWSGHEACTPWPARPSRCLRDPAHRRDLVQPAVLRSKSCPQFCAAKAARSFAQQKLLS